MSRKTRAVARFCGLAKRTAYAHKSRTNRMNMAELFVEICYEILGFRIDGPEDVTVELLVAFVAYLVPLNAVRTIHNKLTTIRRILCVAGFAELANSKMLRSRALGVPPGCRDGTGAAISHVAYVELLECARGLGEPGLEPALKLQRTLGLRRQEALMAGPTLLEWHLSLFAGDPIPVRHGAKNHRPRVVRVPDRDAALEAVDEAMEVAANRGGVLIRGELATALSRYSYLMYKYTKVKGHSLRYAFAKQAFLAYRAAGLTEDEAWSLVSTDLGHGVDREDLMRCVYLKDVIPRKVRTYKRKAA